MRVDKLTSFEAETLIRFFLNHLRPELRGKLIVELPVIYRKLLDRPNTAEFQSEVKKAVLNDSPKLCACGQLYTTDEQFKECVEREQVRDKEDETAAELDRVLANLEEDE